MDGSTKRKLKKEYIPLLIALLVLVLLILLLIIVFFYDEKKGLKIPDTPENERVNIGVFDMQTGKFNEKDLSSGDTTFVKVDYNIISDYYSNSILLANPRVELVDNEIVISSQNIIDAPYISVIGLDGKLKWLNKVPYEKYEYLTINSIVNDDNYFYAIVEAEKNKKKDIIALKFNRKNGKEEKREVIVENVNNSIKGFKKLDNGLAVVTAGKDNIIIYHLNTELKLASNPFILAEEKINMFHSSIPGVSAVVSSGDNIGVALSYYYSDSGAAYLLNLDLKNKTSKLDKFTEINSLSKEYTGYIYGIDNKFYTELNNKILSYDINGKKSSSYSYEGLKLEDQKNYGHLYDAEGNLLSEVGEVQNEYYISELYKSGANMIVKGQTSFNVIYDVFDSNFKLTNRYMVNAFNYNYEEARALKSFYIDGKLYEVYTYGDETASIMVAVIG